MARKRPKMKPRIRRAVYERDGFTCRNCGWAVEAPEGYDGKRPIEVQVGTRRRLVRHVRSWTDRPEIREYRDEPVFRYLQVDHIIPLSAGGAFEDMDNLQALCSTCNYRKGAKV